MCTFFTLYAILNKNNSTKNANHLTMAGGWQIAKKCSFNFPHSHFILGECDACVPKHGIYVCVCVCAFLLPVLMHYLLELNLFVHFTILHRPPKTQGFKDFHSAFIYDPPSNGAFDKKFSPPRNGLSILWPLGVTEVFNIQDTIIGLYHGNWS